MEKQGSLDGTQIFSEEAKSKIKELLKVDTLPDIGGILKSLTTLIQKDLKEYTNIQEYLSKVSDRDFQQMDEILWCLSFPQENKEILGFDKEKEAEQIAQLIIEALKCRAF